MHPVVKKITEMIERSGIQWADARDPTRPHPASVVHGPPHAGFARRRGLPGSKRKKRQDIEIDIRVRRVGKRYPDTQNQCVRDMRHIKGMLSTLSSDDLVAIAHLIWEPREPQSIVDKIAALER